jgi:hypothetical protein
MGRAVSKDPRGFALLLQSATAAGWGWVAFSHRGVIETGSIVDHKRVVVEHAGVKTVVIAWRGRGARGERARSICAWWADGKYVHGWHRDARDPVPVAIGARALRPLIEDVDNDDETGPRWTRPDLGEDEK